MLGVIAIAELLGMSLWLGATAVAPQYRHLWGLSPSQGAWLTTVVQLGFVAGTAAAALLNVADIFPSRLIFTAGALAGAAANAMLLSAGSYRHALLWRFITGVALAGVYPPAMKMAATWFREQRGLAVGAVVGALTIGKATPYLVHGIIPAEIRPVIVTLSLCATISGILIFVLYRDGPFVFPKRPFSWGLIASVIRERQWRLATGGYLGHMFELYSAWTWLPVFISSSVAIAIGSNPRSESLASLIAFLSLAVGGAGCIWGGLVADRKGREWLVIVALIVSGLCSLAIGLSYGRALWFLIPLSLLWGFSVVADSAQFSVLVTESVPQHAVGTALTLQTSLGFLLTAVTIQLVPPLVQIVGWRWSFVFLAAGPVFGILSVRRLLALKREGGARALQSV